MYKSFPALTSAISAALPVREAILDGEIVYLGKDGTPQFYDLMRRRGPQYFYAFDLLWLDGRDLRDRPLIKRKLLLRQIVPPQPSLVLYVDHVAAAGVDLRGHECGWRRGEARDRHVYSLDGRGGPAEPGGIRGSTRANVRGPRIRGECLVHGGL